jgi:hypothetical protein
MTEKSSDEINVPKFMEIIANYSDEELRKVLKKRRLYQIEAAEFAVEEAIKRGIINSEQDLLAAEFQPEPRKYSLFPIIENDKIRGKFKKSIARSLLILVVLPLVWGSLKIIESQNMEGILILVFGVSWGLASFKLMHSVNMNLIYFMFAMLLIAVAYIVKIFVYSSSMQTFDIIVSALSVGFVFYGVGFLSKLKD